jgi:amino acid transporter
MVIYPFLVGVEMMGVFHAVGLKTNSKLIFAFLKRGSWVAVCALLTSVLITLGMSLFVFPGIYLAVALSLVLPLVVDKKLSPIKAITLSLQVTRFQWFKLLAIYSLLFLTLFLSLIPLAILAKTQFSVIGVMLFLVALTFIAPLFYNVKGILYREIFGMQLQASDVTAQQTSDTFSA